jgi:hypothetical protein
MEECAAAEQASQGKDQSGKQGLHHEDATAREEKRSMRSVTTMFLVGAITLVSKGS